MPAALASRRAARKKAMVNRAFTKKYHIGGKKAMKNNQLWIDSKKAAEAAEAAAREEIFAACYAKNEKALDAAIHELKSAARAAAGWQVWIDSSDEDRRRLAIEKARGRADVHAKKRRKNPSDVMQEAEDAAEEALMYIYFDIEEATARAPESILAFIAGKYISAYNYRNGGRNGREESIDEKESIDAFLYSKNVFGPGPEAALLANDTKAEILAEVKSKYREEAAVIIDMLSAGYTQEEVATATGKSQQVISYRLNQIRAAAAIVEENNRRDSMTEKQIESDENTLYNMAIRRGQRWPKK